MDLALVYIQDESSARFPREALLEESLYLVGAPDAELDMDKPVSLAQIREVPLILPARPHAVREMVDRECAVSGVTLNITAETRSMHVQKNLIMSGVGLSILSGFVIADEIKRGALTASPIASANLRRKLYLARSAGQVTTPAASCVLDELRNLVRDCVQRGLWPGSTLLA